MLLCVNLVAYMFVCVFIKCFIQEAVIAYINSHFSLAFVCKHSYAYMFVSVCKNVLSKKQL